MPGHDIEDIRLHDIRIYANGGGTEEWAKRQSPERENGYPEPGMFGPTPSFGLFARHVRGLSMHDVEFYVREKDARPGVVMEDVKEARFDRVTPSALRPSASSARAAPNVPESSDNPRAPAASTSNV